MFEARALFHKISYLQYPLMLIGIYYAVQPYIVGFDYFFESVNNLLIFIGLGISVSTLQDTTTTQNEVSRKIWQDPKKGKLLLSVLGATTLFLIIAGMYGAYVSTSENFKELSFGIIVLGIGLIGMLKAAIEMFENHRLDKNPPA